MKERWSIAKEKRVCFRCLASDHEGRACTKARPCNINGCTRNHHYLLHGFAQGDTRDGRVVTPREGAPTHTHTSTSKQETTTEAFSLRTVPVWLKANDRKVKVNAILDDGSNETFLNEEVAGVLGLKERYQTVTVNVLNNEVETFQSMPLDVTIESLDGEFSKDITVKTCPKTVTGNYKVENWKQSKDRWAHLKECDFAEPAQDGVVDLLIGVDNAELHYSRADVRGEEGGPVARLGTFGLDMHWITRRKAVDRSKGTCQLHVVCPTFGLDMHWITRRKAVDRSKGTCQLHVVCPGAQCQR